MNPTSHIWLRGDESSFSVGDTAQNVAELVAAARENCSEFVGLKTPEGRALIVDPVQVVAIREAVDEAPAEHRCGFHARLTLDGKAIARAVAREARP